MIARGKFKIMNLSIKSLPFAFAILLSGCGGGDSDQSGTPSVGLKIFATVEKHSGDFANDPTLPGSTAIQKADYFCNKSVFKPSNDTYKALIVDGVNRDAVTQTDWVLRPNTSYFQAYGDVLIDVTTANATFAGFYRSMFHSVSPNCKNCSQPWVWTGIGGATFAAAPGLTCNGWGQTGSIVSQTGTFGSSDATDGFSFYSGSTADCVSIHLSLYCVQQ